MIMMIIYNGSVDDNDDNESRDGGGDDDDKAKAPSWSPWDPLWMLTHWRSGNWYRLSWKPGPTNQHQRMSPPKNASQASFFDLYLISHFVTFSERILTTVAGQASKKNTSKNG